MMVAASTLRKLSSDLDALSAKLRPFGGVMFVAMPEALEPYKERVIARHREMFPEDSDADLVCTTVYCDRPGGRGQIVDPDKYSKIPGTNRELRGKHDEAWRSVARELIKGGKALRAHGN